MWPQRCFQALSNLRPSSPRGRAAFFRQRRRHQKFRTWRCICLRPLPGAQMALSGKTKHDPTWHASGFLPSSGASAPAVACAWHVLCRIMPPNRSGSRRHPACRACSGAESQGSATPGLCFRFRHKKPTNRLAVFSEQRGHGKCKAARETRSDFSTQSEKSIPATGLSVT